MKYKIHNLSSIEPASLQPIFEEEVQQKIRQLEQFLHHYPSPLELHIHVKKEDHQYAVAATLPMRGRILTVREKGMPCVALLKTILEQIRKQAREQVYSERKDYLLKKRQRQTVIITSGTGDLYRVKQENDTEYFVFLLQKLLPALKQYIHLSAGKMHAFQPLLKQNKVRIYDLYQRTYQALFVRFGESTASDKLHLWAIRETDHILPKLARQYQNRFLKETGYSENGFHADTDTSHTEELPDLFENASEEQFFNNKQYNAEEILRDAGAHEVIVEEAAEGLFDDRFMKWFHELDAWHTAVFYLYYQMRLSMREIAVAKQQSETTINNTLNDLRTSLVAFLNQD